MPSNPASLGVTEAYRTRMVAIRKEAESVARTVWGDVDPLDVMGTFLVGPLASAIATLQQTGVLLSQAYVKAYIQSEIAKDVIFPTPQGFSGTSWDDVQLRAALLRPVIIVKRLLAEGVDSPEAMRRGRNALLRTVALATDSAIRNSLRQLYIERPEIIGWKRAVGGTCDKCIGKAINSTLPPGEPLDIHPNCVCVSEAVVRLQGRDAEKYTEEHQKLLKQGIGWDAVQAYQGEGSLARPLNRYLRGLESGSVFTKDMKKGMDAAMKETGPLNAPLEVYRGVAETPDALGLVEGQISKDAGFQSTTFDKDLADFVAEMHKSGDISTLMKLEVDPRVKGIWINSALEPENIYNPMEGELVLDRNLRLLVTSIKKAEGSTRGPGVEAEMMRHGWDVEAKVLPARGAIFQGPEPKVTSTGVPILERGDVAKAIFGGAQDSIDLNTDANGVYTQERQQRHEMIIEHFLDDHKPQEVKRALFTAGGPGSGKSTMLNTLTDKPIDAVDVNPDLVKDFLPEYGPMAAARDPFAGLGVHEESSMLAKEINRQAQEAGLNVIIDGAGDSEPGKFRGKLDAAVENGYQVDVAVAHLPIEEGQKRVIQRAIDTGRSMPADVVDTYYREMAARFGDYNSDADIGLRVFDTNVPRGDPAIQIADKPLGKLELNVTDEATMKEFQNEATAPPGEAELKQYLNLVATTHPDAPSFEKMVLEDGVDWNPQELPKVYEHLRGPTGNCYQNATDVVMDVGGKSNPDELRYVEGYAVPKNIPIPIHHAWLVDKDGNVIDNTWPDAGSSYRGVVVPRDELGRLLVEQEYYGVGRTLANEAGGGTSLFGHPVELLAPDDEYNDVGNSANGIDDTKPPPAGWTVADVMAVNHYLATNESYDINRFLREGFDEYFPLTEEKLQSMVDGLDTTFSHADVTELPVKAYRGVSDRYKMGLDGTAEDLIGKEFIEKGFSSSSAEEDQAVGIVGDSDRGIVFELHVQPGVSAIWGGNPQEEELLLNRNLRYVITSAELLSPPESHPVMRVVADVFNA